MEIAKRQLFFLFWIFQTSCTINTSIRDLGDSAHLNKSSPSVISSITLLDPTSDKGTDSTPTVRISGVNLGETVKLYIDSQCQIEVGSGVSTSTSIDITSRVLTDGEYSFYARAFDSSGESSSCSTSFVTYKLSVPTQLVITQQPTNSNVMTPFSPSLKIEIRNSSNQRIDFATNEISVEIQTDPNGTSQLSGTTSVAAVAGVAEFSNLSIDLPGNGYVLKFSVPSLVSVSSVSFNISPLALSVISMYPVNGINWMDNVQRNSLGLPNSGVDAVCSAGFPLCLHGGEIRKVVVSGFSSCMGLAMTDQLGAFDWTCVETTSPVYFFSELKPSKGLKDLLSATAFLTNKITVTKNSVSIGESTLTTWWSNPVSNLTLNSGGADAALNLNTSGTIYTVSTTGTSRGFNLSSPKVALVVLGSNTVSNTATLARDCDNNWPGSQGCIVWAYNNLQWIEGQFSLSLSGLPAVFTGAATTLDSLGIRLHNVKITLSGGAQGIFVDGDYGYFTNLEISAPTGSGTPLSLAAGDGTYIKNAKIFGGTNGIYQGNQGWLTTLYNVSVSGASGPGMSLSSWYANVINSKVFNNGGYGIEASTNKYNSLQNTIIANNTGGGINYTNGDSIIRSNLITNNLAIGFKLDPDSFYHVGYYENNIITNNATGMEVRDYNSIFENSLITNNGTGIVISGTSTDNTWTGKLVLGNTTDCSITSSGANPGLATANCNLQGPSDASRVTGISAVNYFNGSVVSESVNTHTSGTSVASSVTDWFRFENFYRFWGKGDVTSLSSTIRGHCTGAGTCRIWDFRLSSSASQAIEVNGHFDEGVNCPASINGNVFRTYWGNSTYKIYALVNASEIMDDDLGNENGFCESNETCFFAGNIGPYQGSGNPTKSCLFQNGTTTNSVTNVKMYGW